MLRSLNYFKSLRYITTTGVVLAVLVIIAMPTIFVHIGNSAFQIADGLYLALIVVIPGPMLLIDGILWPIFFDLAAGAAAYIPMSILVRLLMFFAVKLLTKPMTAYGSFLVAGVLLFLYLPYNYALNSSVSEAQARADLLREFVVDAIQYMITLILAVALTTWFTRPKMALIFGMDYLIPYGWEPNKPSNRALKRLAAKRRREALNKKHRQMHDLLDDDQTQIMTIDDELTMTENVTISDYDEDSTNTTKHDTDSSLNFD